MNDLSTARNTLHHFIDAHFDEQVRALARLVQRPSDNPPGDCAPHAELTAGLLEAMGFEVERHSVPAELAALHGMRSVTNLIVRERFGEGPVVALNAHGDVVPPGEGWSADPYGGEVRDGWLYGRGAAVSKSDFTTYAFALRALKALAGAGAALCGTVELHFTYDEETGGMTGPGSSTIVPAMTPFIHVVRMPRRPADRSRVTGIWLGCSGGRSSAVRICGA